MHASTEDWGNGVLGLRLALSPEDIDRLVRNLGVLRRDPSRHFHMSWDHEPVGKVGDVEVSLLGSGQEHNMSVGGGALYPGEEIPLPPLSFAGQVRLWWRRVAAGILGMVGVLAGLEATGRLYVTYATNDYRPILIGGVWAAAWALLAFHGAAVAARGWRARAVCLVGAAMVLAPLALILDRLRV